MRRATAAAGLALPFPCTANPAAKKTKETRMPSIPQTALSARHWRTPLRRLGAALVPATLATLAALPISAAAQAWPQRPISLVVPVGAGTSADVVARTLQQKIVDNWGHPMIVENRVGNGGVIGMEYVARAKPDGYTIVLCGTSQLLTPIVTKTGYDVPRDFTGIAYAGMVRYAAAVPNSLPVKDLKELVALARARPGKLNYAALIGTVPHFMGEVLKAETKTDIMMIPYNSTTDAQTDVVAGRVEIWFTPLTSALGFAKEGRIKVLGVSSDKRAPLLPEVPTMAEAGFPSLDVSVDFFILAPTGTPEPIVRELNAQINRAMNDAGVRGKMTGAGVEYKVGTVAEVTTATRSETTRWTKVAKDANIRLQ